METRRAAIYCRISRDPLELGVRVEQQQEDCRRIAANLGAEVAGVFIDNNISASHKSRKRQDQFEQMLAEAEAGGYDVLVFYSTSRLTRRGPAVYDRLIPMNRAGVLLRTVVSGDIDLTTADGLMMAKMRAIVDEHEANVISERTTRAARQRAEHGEYHGGPMPLWITRTPKGFVPHHPYADWMREAMRRVLAGETLYGILRDWQAKGRTTPGGARWEARTLKRALLSPAMVGRRAYNGGDHRAPWPAIVDQDDWDRAHTILTDPGRGPYVGSTRKYPLSGLVWCALCEHVMTATGRRADTGATSLECSRVRNRGGCGKVRISMDPLERYITEQVFYRADTPELHAAIAASRGVDDGQDKELRAAVAQAEQALIQLDNDRDDGLIPDRATYVRRRNRISDRLQVARKALATITRAHVHIPSGDVLRTEWGRRDADWKRTTLGAVIERIYIKPHPAGVTTSPVRKRSESDDEWTARRDAHFARVFRERVDVVWIY